MPMVRREDDVRRVEEVCKFEEVIDLSALNGYCSRNDSLFQLFLGRIGAF